MTSATARRTAAPTKPATLADLRRRLGDIPLARIRLQPPPGTAKEADVLMRPGGEKRLFELVEGALVEKPMGYYESLLAAILVQSLGAFVERHDLGIVLGADATLRLFPGLVRLPDVCFVAWSHFPGRKLPRNPIPDLVPDFAAEILSKTNTKREMQRKRREYFAAGVRLVWEIDPPTKTVRVYADPNRFVEFGDGDVLSGGKVLPGFRLSVRRWFERAGEQADE